MKLYVVRHGQTEENVSGILQGQNHGTLTPWGREQAQRVALRLRAIRFDAIYTSDLARAHETAQAIAAYHHVPFYPATLLRERHAGIFQGRHVSEMVQAESDAGIDHTEYRPPEGENYRDVRQRVATFLAQLNAAHKRDTILLVSHGRWMRMFWSLILQKSIPDALAISQANTCVNVVQGDLTAGFEVELLNCTAHLTSHPEAAAGVVTRT